jgi:hypothetical protein
MKRFGFILILGLVANGVAGQSFAMSAKKSELNELYGFTWSKNPRKKKENVNVAVDLLDPFFNSAFKIEYRNDLYLASIMQPYVTVSDRSTAMKEIEEEKDMTDNEEKDMTDNEENDTTDNEWKTQELDSEEIEEKNQEELKKNRKRQNRKNNRNRGKRKREEKKKNRGKDMYKNQVRTKKN